MSEGLRIACSEEIAYNRGFVTRDRFVALPKKFEKSTYGQYLVRSPRKSVTSRTLEMF
jgi:glucose-1-phosphate thymidylyltransferase